MIQDKPTVAFEPFTQTPLRTLDHHGNWVASFPNPLSEAQLAELYHDMLATRLFDERWFKLQRMGKSSFTAPCSGHEAAQIGTAHALQAGFDWVCPYYRDTGLLLALGLTPLEMLAQYTGSSLDVNRAKQMPCHAGSQALNIFTPISVIAGSLPPAVGLGLSMKLKQTGQVCLASFGDGASSANDFHAALNLASVQRAPVVFLCQNNHYAISVPFEKQSGSHTVANKAHAYGMPGYLVDGMDVIACYLLIKQAVQRARAGQPALIDAQLYRYGPHSSADDDLRYRSQEEKDYWLARDPLKRLKAYMLHQGYWDDDWENEQIARITSQLDDAVAKLDTAPPVAHASLIEDVFAEPTPQLKLQAERWL